MMYARRQVVNSDLLVVMNGRKALCLPLFAAAELCCSVISDCVCCSEADEQRVGFYVNMQPVCFYTEDEEY